MPGTPKILVVRDRRGGGEAAMDALCQSPSVVEERHLGAALSRLGSESFDGLYVAPDHFMEARHLGELLTNEHVLDGMADGVVVLNADNLILWANKQFRDWSRQRNPQPTDNFYLALGSPEILGPDFCPFHTALATGVPSGSTLRTQESRYFHVHAAPDQEGGGKSQRLIVTVRDVTAEMLQQQKLHAIHKAGADLANLKPDEVFLMQMEDRVELLKSNILHYTQDLLKFNVVEIRLLEQGTGQLTPLLAVGLDLEAIQRPLWAKSQDNGVTGFVAATGKSYLCEDTNEDPLYLTGFEGARSSLTVPLMLHDQVIGTFNVESPEPRAFNENDLQFLEIFSRDVAVALNTLDLLVAQKANAALESVEAIHRAVALPIDEILNEAVNVMERYIGHEPQVVERLQHILRNARNIKQVIQKVGQTLTPTQAVPVLPNHGDRPKLRNRRILVVDADEAVRDDAHALLERFGCVVETAHFGEEAVYMVRNCGPLGAYDAILADINLPDMNGYGLMLKLHELIEPIPLILMTGFGYDPGHTIVKARQAGLHPKAILFKPFRLDQLLETVETIVEWCGAKMPQVSA